MTKEIDITGCSDDEIVKALLDGLADFGIVAYTHEDIIKHKLYLSIAAIKALEQEPCEDAIDRAEAMTEIMMFTGNVKSDEEDIYIKVSDALQLLRELPPVNPQEPRTGHWIRWYEQKEHDWGIDHIPHCKCSECGKEYDPHSSQFIKFCSECGVKMAESEE